MAASSTSGRGRPKGSRNKRTRAYDIAKTLFAPEGKSPLEMMARIMWDESQDMSLRLQAARDAAPYVHAKIATQIDVNAAIQFVNPNPLLNGNGPA